MTHFPKVGSDFRLRKSAPVFDPVCLQPNGDNTTYITQLNSKNHNVNITFAAPLHYANGLLSTSMPGAVHDLITPVNFGEDRLSGFGVAMGRILGFALTCVNACSLRL